MSKLIVFRSERVNNFSSNNNSTPIAPPEPNKPMSFGDERRRTVKEIVYGSKIRSTLNLDIEVLTNDSVNSRIAKRNRRNGILRIPRRQNAWIIYRRDKSASPEFVGLRSSIVSQKIREMWHSVSIEEREYFEALSMEALENHIKKYGADYKYQPKLKNKQKSEIKIRKEENVSSKLGNAYLPTPAELSPVSDNSSFIMKNMEMPLFDIENDQYLLTPATTNQHSPVTSEENFFEFSSPTMEINQYPSPPTTIHSPVTSEELMNDDLSEFITNANIHSSEFSGLKFFAPLSDISPNPPKLPLDESLINAPLQEPTMNAENFFLSTTSIQESATAPCQIPEGDFFDALQRNVENDQLPYQQENFSYLQYMNEDLTYDESEWQFNFNHSFDFNNVNSQSSQ
ncbi:hypothetical protein C1645_819915 [Glomus cerebriforme]|uniref:HMG box domain-containing protein n=1 Tax=Glomus cerebriforme TaxID=658196 RepID=A0A397T6M8_9GLOM|nr:hypothetical protein C1645_819915 [Glomus cerebriforme]